MKLTKEENKKLAKSIYKAVHKALGTSVISEEAQQKARAKSGKDAIEDVMDPNFIAEAKDKSPVKRTAQMNKAQKGVHNPIPKDPKGGKSKLGVLNEIRNKAKEDQNTRKELYAEIEQRKESLSNIANNKKKKPSLPKSEKNIVKSENGIEKLRKFIKNKHE